MDAGKSCAALARNWTDARPDDGQSLAHARQAALNTGDPATASAAFERAAQRGMIYAADPLPSAVSSTH